MIIEPPAHPDAIGDPELGAALAHYGPPAARLKWIALGSGGGFSGARVWRGDDPNGRPELVLKAWLLGGMTAQRLADIHRRMLQLTPLPFVPAVLPALNGQTVVSAAGRLWDLSGWVPGTADYRAHPTVTRLANACTALAHIHTRWRPAVPDLAPSACIRRRLKVIDRWRELAESGAPCAALHPAVGSAIEHGWRVARVAVGPAEALLRTWDDWPVFVQPCLCDVWGAHVLFTGDAVTGVIDYGSVKYDHVAVDLARLLGDLVEDDDTAFAAGLDAYRAAGGVLDMPADFVRLLDRTGAVCGVMNWLLRLCGGGYEHPDMPAVVARLTRLAARVERLFPD